MTRLHLIFARARNGVIGRAGTLPWHLPQDLAHFKRTTMGAPVLMGRQTWESLPAAVRPLPGRRNIVLTCQPDWQPEVAAGRDRSAVLRADSVEQAIRLCDGAPDAWVIGGAALFAAALPLAATAVVTEIDADFDGDTWAPAFGADWVQGDAVEGPGSTAALPFAIRTWRRIDHRTPNLTPIPAAR